MAVTGNAINLPDLIDLDHTGLQSLAQLAVIPWLANAHLSLATAIICPASLLSKADLA
jgi:hypothetical protein